MILTPYEMPSRGLDKTSEPVNIEGMGFQDMLEYSREYEKAKTPYQKYLIDYKWIKKSITNWQSINLVDLDAIILRWKIESVSRTNEFTVRKACPECGEVCTLNLEMDQLTTFIPVEFDLSGEVVLGDTRLEYKIPNLLVFDEVLTRLSKSGRCKDIELAKLISFFPDFKVRPNIVESMVLNAKLDDIQVLKTLSSVYLRSEISINTRCTNCKNGVWSMGVTTLIDDPFLSLVLSSGSIRDKISLKQIQ
jgi:hypothetical protein